MARYKFHNVSPPGGWRYWQKETRFTIKADSLNALIEKVRGHRTYKGFTPTDRESVRLDIERQICARLTKNECKPEGPEDSWVPLEDPNSLLSIKKVWSFSKAAVDWLTSGRPMVSEAEMQRRAAICLDCPLNQNVTGCGSCGVMGIINSAIPKDRRVDGLNECVACGCSVKALVNVPEGTILAAHEGRTINLPDWCWQPSVSLANQPQTPDKP